MSELLNRGYCLRCRVNRGILNPQEKVTPSGRTQTSGPCEFCGVTISRRGHVITEEPVIDDASFDRAKVLGKAIRALKAMHRDLGL